MENKQEIVIKDFEDFKRFSTIYSETVLELALEITEESPYKNGDTYVEELRNRIFKRFQNEES